MDATTRAHRMFQHGSITLPNPRASSSAVKREVLMPQFANRSKRLQPNGGWKGRRQWRGT